MSNEKSYMTYYPPKTNEPIERRHNTTMILWSMII